MTFSENKNGKVYKHKAQALNQHAVVDTIGDRCSQRLSGTRASQAVLIQAVLKLPHIEGAPSPISPLPWEGKKSPKGLGSLHQWENPPTCQAKESIVGMVGQAAEFSI